MPEKNPSPRGDPAAGVFPGRSLGLLYLSIQTFFMPPW